jgi:predicted ATPase
VINFSSNALQFVDSITDFDENNKADKIALSVSTDHAIHFFRNFIEEVMNNQVFFPAEREGIVLFSKELTVLKNKAFDSLLENGSNQKMLDFLETRYNKYPFPIKDSLETVQNLDAIQKNASEFEFLAELLEKEFLNGKVQIVDDGDIKFTPNGLSHSLDIHMSSSTVKSFSSLSIYLKHLAKVGDFIIIDEPELNLHPNNQIKIARFLARLVNEGFKVMVSTHSDYILRELNSLIMLGTGKKKSPEKTKELLTKFPEYHEKQFLDNEQVGVYLFRQDKDVEELKIREDGFEVATIDETVDRLNETSQNIYYELFD